MTDRKFKKLQEEEGKVIEKIEELLKTDLSDFDLKSTIAILTSIKDNRNNEYETAKKELTETINDIAKLDKEVGILSSEKKQGIEDTIKRYNLNVDVLKEITKDIKKLESITPEKYIMANNKMINQLANGNIREGITDLVVSKQPEVISQISLSYDDDNIKIFDKNKRFTPYDRAVHNAVCSIWEAGNEYLTPNQVYRCMNGLTKGEYVTPQRVGAVTKSIDKARRIYTKIDYRDEAKAWNEKIDKFIVEDTILSAQKVTLEAGGEEVTGYKINTKPILYEYAQVSKQIITVPSKLLNIQGILNSTPEITVLKEYLIRRIEVMKHKRNKTQSNKILFTAIYNELELTDPDKYKTNRLRAHTKTLLQNYKKNKYIKDFKFYKKGRSFHGIEIFY